MPFLAPMPIDDVWFLLVLPLVVAVAVVYKTIRLDDLLKVPRESLRLTGQVLMYMALAMVALWVLMRWR
jgi:TRAP-type C4-dicarboxylate transport system permease large subunit